MQSIAPTLQLLDGETCGVAEGRTAGVSVGLVSLTGHTLEWTNWGGYVVVCGLGVDVLTLVANVVCGGTCSFGVSFGCCAAVVGLGLFAAVVVPDSGSVTTGPGDVASPLPPPRAFFAACAKLTPLLTFVNAVVASLRLVCSIDATYHIMKPPKLGDDETFETTPGRASGPI
jgi:hypothetical protein